MHVPTSSVFAICFSASDHRPVPSVQGRVCRASCRGAHARAIVNARIGFARDVRDASRALLISQANQALQDPVSPRCVLAKRAARTRRSMLPIPFLTRARTRLR